jgi:hypothetical protein
MGSLCRCGSGACTHTCTVSVTLGHTQSPSVTHMSHTRHTHTSLHPSRARRWFHTSRTRSVWMSSWSLECMMPPQLQGCHLNASSPTQTQKKPTGWCAHAFVCGQPWICSSTYEHLLASCVCLPACLWLWHGLLSLLLHQRGGAGQVK